MTMLLKMIWFVGVGEPGADWSAVPATQDGGAPIPAPGKDDSFSDNTGQTALYINQMGCDGFEQYFKVLLPQVLILQNIFTLLATLF